MTRRGLLSTLAASLAVGSKASPPAGRLQAGAAASNITPLLGISLDGPISQNGPATHVHDELHARCLVLGDENTQIAIAICDSTMLWKDLIDEAKAIASNKTGMPPERMLIAATHTHSTPRLGVRNGELERWYRGFLPRRIADGIIRAYNNLSPAAIGWDSVQVPEFVFNRRWFVKPESIPPNPFGETGDRVRMNPPAGSTALIRPAGPVDPEFFVISVRHPDGRPLALLASYGLHYVGGSRRGDISADYFGLFSERVRELMVSEHSDMPFVAMMSNGASGDVNNIDFRKERQRRPPYVRMREVAHDLAEKAVGLSNDVEYPNELTVASAHSRLELAIRRPDQHRVDWARKVWAGAQGADRLTRPQVYARENLALSEYPMALHVPMQALRIGSLGIAAIPCEVFAETGLAIKKHSALMPAFTMGLANGYFGYLPTAEQHEWGGYETWPARSSCLETEAEAKIRAEALRLLKSVSRA